MDEPVLMKLYTVAVYNLRISMKVDYSVFEIFQRVFLYYKH